MQLISALFDAPVPAGMALTALAQEGAAPADLGVWPPLPAIPVPPPRPSCWQRPRTLPARSGCWRSWACPPRAWRKPRKGWRAAPSW